MIRPAETWQRLSQKKPDARKLFFGLAMVLALVPAISVVLGFSLVGLKLGPLETVKIPLTSAILAGIAVYIVNLAGVYAAAVLMRFIGNSFHTDAPFSSYMSLAILSAVPYWLAGAFNLIPALRVLSMIGIYGIYILFLGIPEMIKVPEERNLPFNVAVVVAIIILVLLGNFIISPFIDGPLYAEFLAY